MMLKYVNSPSEILYSQHKWDAFVRLNISVTLKVYNFEAYCSEIFISFVHASQHLQNK